MFSTLFPYLLLMYSFIFKIVCFFISYFVYIFCNSSYFVYIFCNSLMNIMRTFYFVRGTVEIYLYFLFPKIITSIYLYTHTLFFLFFVSVFPVHANHRRFPCQVKCILKCKVTWTLARWCPWWCSSQCCQLLPSVTTPQLASSSSSSRSRASSGGWRKVSWSSCTLRPPRPPCVVRTDFSTLTILFGASVWWLYQHWYDAMICCSQDTNVRCKPLHPQVN